MIFKYPFQITRNYNQKFRYYSMCFQTGNDSNFRAMASNVLNANFDWNEAFSLDNKAKTIENCKFDREKSFYTFPTDESDFRKAAVLVPLCYDVLGRPSILYNLRAPNLSRHSGEISFPGGIMEPGDCDSPIVTALRETEEELGLKREKVEVWALMRDFQTINSNLGVTPVVGFVHGFNKLDPTKMSVNPGEVDHAFTVTLEHLCDSQNWGEMENRKFNISIPVYKNLNVHNNIKSVDLWGLTAVITHLTLSVLLPKVYKRRLSFFEPCIANTNSKM